MSSGRIGDRPLFSRAGNPTLSAICTERRLTGEFRPDHEKQAADGNGQ